MVYLVTFEVDVEGLASTKRINGEMYVFSRDSAAARHFMEGYLTNTYSEHYAIISCVPLFVLNMGE